MSSRMLKELRSLTPWQWDSRASRHPPGVSGLRDFERIEQSFMNQTGSKTRQHDEAHASAKDGPAGATQACPAAKNVADVQTPGAGVAGGEEAAGQKHKRRRLSGSAPPDKAGSLGRSSGGSAKTPSHGPHTPATVAYAPELGRGSGGQPPHTTTPLHPRLQPGAQAATPLPAGAGGAATLLHSLLACAQAGTPLRGEGDTEGPGSSGGGVVGCTPGGVPQPRRPPAANARMPPPSATARRGHRPRPQGGADAAPGAPTPPPHPKAAVPAKRPASPAPLPWGPEGRGASRPAAPEPQRAARGSSKAGGAPAAAPGLEDPELEATLALMSLAPQASALVGGGAPAGAQQRDSPGPAASPRHPAPGRPAAAPASPAGTHGMQQQQQQAPGRPGGRASRLGAARPPLAPAAAPTDPSPRLPQQQRGRAEQGAHASQHVPTRGEVGGGAWGGEAGEEAAGHGGDATSNAAGACTTDGAGGGACPPASAAMLQSMVRAVAAYCHSLQILPTGPNIQLAQAVINLLAGHRPHDACDALHALRPRLPLPDAAGSDDDGAHGPQLPPIAPLVLMDTAVLDADWSTALRPATHATLHALVTGHKALREACGAAAATATASEAEAAAAGGATDGGLPHTQLPAAPAVALEVGGGSAAMVGEGTAQRQVVQAVQQQCCPAPRPCLAPVATNANTATHSATSKGSRSSSGSPRFPIGAGVPHLVGVVGVPQPQHPQL